LRIPEKITQGDYVSWVDISTSDNLGKTIDSSSYDLKYVIRGATSLDLTATTEGSGWKTEISPTASDALQSGTYFWQAIVVNKSDTTKKSTIGNGRIEVLKGLSSVTGVYDGRTQARKDLEAVQAAIRAMVSGGAVQEYSIANRSFRKMSVEDLRILESQLKYDVAKEERTERMRAGLGDPFNMYVRFK
jgi:hypothetical protein